MATIYKTEDGKVHAKVKVGEKITVNHPFYGGVEMEVCEVRNNKISVSFHDIEYTATLRSRPSFAGDLDTDYGFVAEEL